MPKRIRKPTPSDLERIADTKAAASIRKTIRDMEDSYMAGIRMRRGKRVIAEKGKDGENWCFDANGLQENGKQVLDIS